MHAGQVAAPLLSPEPILSAAAAFRGRMIDLDRSLVIEAGDLAGAYHALAKRLRRSGLLPGDRVVMGVGNGPLFITTLVAILEAGGAPLLVHADTPPAELQRTANRFGAKFIACDPQQHGKLRSASVRAVVLSRGDWACLGWAQMDERNPLLQGEYPSLPGVPLHPTSGTTGEPKIAARPGPCAVAEAQHYIESIGIEADDVILNLTPMNHAYAYGLCVIVSLLASPTLVSMRRFSPTLVHRAIAELGITVLPAVPVMLDMLLFGAGDRLYDPSRRIFTAGAPLPARTARNFRQVCGSVVRPLYGSTETGVIAIAPGDHETDADCVGPPVNGVEVKTRASEGTNCREDFGRVYVRSSSMMAGYVARWGLDRSHLVNGWFTPGDLGQFDRLGELHLNGRETDVINVFGAKVVPSEVEEVLQMLPEVAEAKVYAGQSSGSQFVKAAIVAASPIDGAKIRAHCKKHLVYYKQPEAITLLDALPRTPTGKIIRERLP